MKKIAILDDNNKVLNIIMCNDDFQETPKAIMYNDNNSAYINGDYFDGYFYPPKNENIFSDWVRDGKGNWIPPQTAWSGFTNLKSSKKMLIKEDIWSPLTSSKIAYVLRNEDLLISEKYNLDNELIETYFMKNIDEIKNNILKEKLKSIGGMVLVSLDKKMQETDYYISCTVLSKEELSKYNVKNQFLSLTCEILLRFDNLGNYVGLYYIGDFLPLMELYYQNNLNFVNILKEYYEKYQTSYCIIKDFGNNQISIFYDKN